MTVLENVMIGRHCRTSAGIAGAVFQDSRTNAEEQATIDRSYELLREVGLNMHYQDEARNLPYGAQRHLEIARALATDPAVLLLDEITANLDAETETRVLDALRRASEGRTVLSVSHRVYENLGGRTIEIRPQPA